MSNTVIRKPKGREKPYFTAMKAYLSDNRMSWKAKGLHTYFLSKPDDWVIRVSDLIKRSIDGRDSVYGGLKELRKYGYLVFIEYRTKGKYIRSEYVVYEEGLENPQDKLVIDVDSDIVESQPLTENPNTVKPNTQKPHITKERFKLNNECTKASHKKTKFQNFTERKFDFEEIERIRRLKWGGGNSDKQASDGLCNSGDI